MLSIALHADNEKKNLLDNFCIAYKNILSKHHLLATESTANHVKAATGLEVSSLLAGRLGGNRQLESAIANAENNNGMNADNLYVAECFANKGPTMKRVRPRAQGRAYRIEKRMSHITVVLDER